MTTLYRVLVTPEVGAELAEPAMSTAMLLRVGGSVTFNGDLIGATSFADLDDVTVTDPEEGQVPTWDGTRWVNATSAGSAGAAQDVTYDNTGRDWDPVTSPAPEDVQGAVDALLAGVSTALETDSSGLPDGGVDGQALLKQSGTDGDADWEDLTAGGAMAGTLAALTINDTAFQAWLVGKLAEGAHIDLTVNGDGDIVIATTGYGTAATRDVGTETGQVMSADDVIPLFDSVSDDIEELRDGKADLVGGTVPANQLPSFVDDVLEYANLGSFPASGETGKIYVALDTNLTYRWTGSVYGVLDPSLALGETSSTAYRGDRGKTAYDHSQDVTTDPHGDRAYARQRANHTGTQAMSTISDAGALATKSAIASGDITDGTIVDADISGSAAIAQSKVASLTSDLAAKAPATRTVGTGLSTTGTVNLDLSTLHGTIQTITATGNITFTTSNLTAGREVTLIIAAGASGRTLAYPAWIAVGAALPTSLASGKTLVVTLFSPSTTDAVCIAAAAAQP